MPAIDPAAAVPDRKLARAIIEFVGVRRPNFSSAIRAGSMLPMRL